MWCHRTLMNPIHSLYEEKRCCGSCGFDIGVVSNSSISGEGECKRADFRELGVVDRGDGSSRALECVIPDSD